MRLVGVRLTEKLGFSMCRSCKIFTIEQNVSVLLELIKKNVIFAEFFFFSGSYAGSVTQEQTHTVVLFN